MKLRLLKCAAAQGWSADYLPTIKHMVELIDELEVPFDYDRKLVRVCMQRILTAIKGLVTPDKLGPGLKVTKDAPLLGEQMKAVEVRWNMVRIGHHSSVPFPN